MSNWNMPPGVTTADIPGQDEDAIEAACDDLRMALQDLASNGPNEDDYERVSGHLHGLAALANNLNRGA
jgi:hypothetical protein